MTFILFLLKLLFTPTNQTLTLAVFFAFVCGHRFPRKIKKETRLASILKKGGTFVYNKF